MSTVSRRQLLQAGAAGSALLLAGPGPGLAATPLRLGGASRRSRLFPKSRRFLIHADMHNHTLLSGDAVGDPTLAYDKLRKAGLDAATLTEHAIMGKGHGQYTCPSGPCKQAIGINDNDWATVRKLADAANKDGRFTTARAFEWTTPTMGHINVWFGDEWIDGLRSGAIVTPRGGSQLDQLGPVPQPILDVFAATPDTATMDRFYDWFAAQHGSDPKRDDVHEPLAGFNHPNEYGNFHNFAYDARVARRMVTCEAINMDRDYFFFGVDEDKPHPLAAVLDHGWRTGFIGVSDNHEQDYRWHSRAGVWVTDLTRGGLREALLSRRVFATLVPELRLDAAANGVPMGRDVRHESGAVRIDLDIGAGPDWAGKPITIQVVRPGKGAPTLAKVVKRRIPRANQAPVRFHVDVDVADGAWMFLRITDPSREPDAGASGPFADGRAIAYSSPFWFSPDANAKAVTAATTGRAGAVALGAAALLRLRADRLSQLTHEHPHPH